MWSGMTLLVGYSLGMAVPFILVALGTSHFLRVSKKYRHLMPTIEKASGVLLVIVGILLVTGRFTALSAFFARFTPDFLLDRL